MAAWLHSMRCETTHGRDRLMTIMAFYPLPSQFPSSDADAHLSEDIIFFRPKWPPEYLLRRARLASPRGVIYICAQAQVPVTVCREDYLGSRYVLLLRVSWLRPAASGPADLLSPASSPYHRKVQASQMDMLLPLTTQPLTRAGLIAGPIVSRKPRLLSTP